MRYYDTVILAEVIDVKILQNTPEIQDNLTWLCCCKGRADNLNHLRTSTCTILSCKCPCIEDYMALLRNSVIFLLWP